MGSPLLKTRSTILPSHPIVYAGCVALLIMTLAGCGNGDRNLDQELQKTMASAEQLLDNGSATGARKLLLENLQASSGTWKGKEAGAAYRMLGDLSRRTAQLDSAIAFYSLAEDAFRARAQRELAFRMELAIVDVYRLMQLDHEAALRASEALRLATLFGDSSSVTAIRWTLLDISSRLEQPEETERLASVLRSSCLQARDEQGEARIFYILGMGQAQRQEWDAAATSLLQSVTLSGRGRDSLLMTQALLGLGRVFERSGRVREAQESFATVLQQRAAFAARPSLEYAGLLSVGNFYLRNQRADVALAYFTRGAALAQTMSHQLGEAYALLQKGHCQELLRNAEAATLYKQGLELLQKNGCAPGMAYALLSLGRLAEQHNEVTDAGQFYRAAVDAHESAFASRDAGSLWVDCEESALGWGNTNPYGASVALSLQQGKTDEAFWYQERSNARALSDDMASWGASSAIPAANAPLQEYRHLRALHTGAEGVIEQLASGTDGTVSIIAAVRAELARVSEQMSAQADRARHEDPKFEAVVNADGAHIADVQQSLPADAILLQYMPTSRGMFVCAITPTASSVQMAVTAPQRIATLCDGYLRECALRASLADSSRVVPAGADARLTDLTRGLYEALVLPIETLIRPNSRLIVVFPGRFPAVPLAGLRRGGSLAAPALGDRCMISYLPTARFAMRKAPLPQVVRTVMGFGMRGTTSWDVEYELRDIHSFYRTAILLFGKDANIASLRSTQADLLHLALEVRFRTQPRVTGAFLCGDGATIEGSQPVSFGSVFSLPPVPVVVLSNLSPAVPSTDRAIAAAFLANGSAAVITNATPMTRKAKKMFGEGFYTALQSGGQVPSALRTAQAGMARTKDLASTCFWSPLMLWGSEGREQPKR
jgi:tetratricopeptide (TPR) repeat protein